MGGLGSGRPSSGAPTCEGCLNIDLAWLRRRGMLQPGRLFRGHVVSVGRANGLDHAGCAERRRAPDLPNERIATVRRSTSPSSSPSPTRPPCSAASRQWLRCLKCGRGCRKIYGGRYFRCRLCYRLRYASQGESRRDQRALDRARKIAKRLHDRWGGATEEEYDFPPKPPRMRWATYNRLEEQYDELENAADARWAVRIMTRFARY